MHHADCVVNSAKSWLQCVSISALCDDIKQCVDGSDEQRCDPPRFQSRSSLDLPILVDFQRTGDIVRTSLRADKGSVDSLCPETHFWCPDRDLCLPVFVRCNGVYDCPGHEDENGCDVYTCPGFYRCRASKICVHVTHVCDDWPLCPQHDDELLCGQACPPQCTCHGLAFFCSQVFAAHQFPDLRYLDVRGSGMNMHHLGDNHMLIHLSLASCGVRAVGNLTFHNLNSLDLSDNLLTEVSGRHFGHMPQLAILFLAGNPLTSVFTTFTDPHSELHKIHMLDLSRVKMQTVDPSLFALFPNLRSLNLSHSGMEQLQWNSSQIAVTSLRKLDLRGCVIEEFPRDVLRGFLQLQLLFTDNFKLCCPSVLPSGFDLNHCHASPDEVSSCEDLFGVAAHRVVVSVLAALALLGNTLSLIVRVCVRSTWRLSSDGVVLTHLSVADLGTGLYLATLGLADHLLAGHYVWQDVAWRRGAVCHLTGVLALSCRHAATVFITILSLYRCLHQIPTLSARLTPVKVKVMCVVVWVSSLILASVPWTAQWRIFGQQALCVPLPVERNDSLESRYIKGVMVFVQFVMFTLCFLCEVVRCVCGRVANASIMNKDIRCNDSQFVVFGSLISGFLYTIACLVPTDSHTDRQKATHTALVYFGSVVSCATNPCLHLYGVRVERSKQIKQERLLKIVKRTRL